MERTYHLSPLYGLLRVLLMVQVLLISLPTTAQLWIGHISDNYAGLQRAHIQPASVVSMPYKLDVGFVGIQAGAHNVNGIASIARLIGDGTLDESIDEESFLVNFNVQLPSFAWRINEKSAVAFEVTYRGLVSAEASSSDVIALVQAGFDNENLLGRTFDDAYLTGLSHLWWDFSGTYAHQIYQSSEHQIDAGATLKLLSGTGSAHFNVDNLSFTFAEEDVFTNVSGRLQMAYSENIEQMVDDRKVDLFDAFSLGASLGTEYRWTPTPEEQYKLRAGISFVDIGNLSYKRSSDSEDYSLGANEISLQSFEDAESLDALQDSLESSFETFENTDDEISVALPTQMVLQVDYHVLDGFYVEMASYIALRGDSRKVDETFNNSRYMLTPRYEKEQWGVSIPFYYSEISGFNTALSGRFGPVFLGMDNIIQVLSNGNIGSIAAFIGVKLRRWP
ncbi:MAG: DUF5723 family protein [Bacteroidota bacterium]